MTMTYDGQSPLVDKPNEPKIEELYEKAMTEFPVTNTRKGHTLVFLICKDNTYLIVFPSLQARGWWFI